MSSSSSTSSSLDDKNDADASTTLDPKLISEILLASSTSFAAASHYQDLEEEATCRKMVQELSPEEQEIAASTSYAYWVATTTTQKAGNNSSCLVENDDNDNDVRMRMAMREARRHLVGEGGNYDAALANLKKTCQFRKEWKIDLLRSCFSSSSSSTTKNNNVVVSAKDKPEQERYCKLIQKDLGKQVMAIRGHDRNQSAILVKMGRTASETDGEAFLLTQMYMAERAIACTEVLSKGRQGKLVAVFDFGTYASSNSPPWRTIRKTVTLLQHNYPDRLKKLIILDPPLWMRGLYSMIHPFLAEVTRSKVILVSGEANKEASLNDLVEAEQAMPFMLPHGKLTSPIDTHRMLYEVPFHSLYDAV